MALAIASGGTPDAGLVSAIIGGFVISLLSGSRFQIGGPAGAFIVLIASIVERRGMDGLMLSTFLAGGMLVAFGILRLGALIRLVPHAVVVGFTPGIAVLIFASQLHDFFGLTLAGKEPSALAPRLIALAGAAASLNGAALGLSAVSLALILLVRRFRPSLPCLLLAVTLATIATYALQLPVETIGSRFGGVADRLPPPHLPALDLPSLVSALPDAATIALLGGIESLLCAVVADGMSRRRHRSNAELVAQGFGNIAASLFGGLCVTGTIARTATNIRAGARTPVAGMLHSLFLLGFIMVAAPLAAFIPLAALSAVLMVVCLNMIEHREIAALMRGSRRETLVLLTTFLATIFVDLVTGIALGSSLTFLFWLAVDRRRAF